MLNEIFFFIKYVNNRGDIIYSWFFKYILPF